jgi:hypothetical protein
VDEDAEQIAVVDGLRLRGIDALTSEEADRLTASDSEQLAVAASLSRAIYTFNIRDFARLHRDYLQSGKSHYGIIAIPKERYSIGGKIRRIAELAARLSAEGMVNRFEYLRRLVRVYFVRLGSNDRTSIRLSPPRLRRTTATVVRPSSWQQSALC